MKTTLDSTAKSKQDELDSVSAELELARAELSTVGTSLADARQREKSLLEFRSLLAQLIGLDADSLSVPDYEIMARVESLVKVLFIYRSTYW